MYQLINYSDMPIKTVTIIIIKTNKNMY